MMGNVAGVSQFLETAVLPGSQAATESTPSQNFAAVMQQTSNESGTPLPVPGSGAVDGQAEQGRSKTAMLSTQNVAFQATVPAEKDALAQLKNQISLQGKLQGGTGVSAKAFVGVASLDAKVATTVLPMATEGVLSKAGQAAQDVPSATSVTKGSSAAPAANIAATSSIDEEAPALSLAAATSAKLATNTPVVQGAVVPQRTAKETPAVAGNQTAKPVNGKLGENKVDSALTALVPQGKADVPQMDVTAAGTTVATVAGPVMPEAMVSSGTATVPELTGALSSAGVVSAGGGPVPAARLGQGAAVLSSNLTQPTAAKSGVATTPAAPVRVDSAPVAADAGQTWNFVAPAPQPVVAGTPTVTATQAAPVQAVAASGASGVGVALPNVAVGAASGAAMPVAQALPSQPAETAGSALPEPMSTAVQGAITASAAAPAPVNVAAKPVLHVGRGVSLAGAAMPPTTSGAGEASAASQGVPTAAAAPVQGVSAAAVPAVHAATANAGPTTAAASGPQTAIKSVTQAVSGVAPQPGAVQTKAAVLDSSSPSASVAVKDFSDAAAAPVAGQAAVSLPATSGMVSTATVVVPALPLPHATTGAGTGTMAATGFVSAASASTGVSGVTGGGSLPHTTLSATPTSLEVGVSSGTHGWLKIRAELNAAGEVNASLTGVNSAAATKLRGDLPALNSFLQDEKVQMGALDVRSALHTAGFASGSTFSQAGSGQGGAGGANGAAVSTDAGAAGNRAQQQAQQGAETVPVVSESDEVSPGRISDLGIYGNQTELGGSDGSSSVGYGAGGSWLNVRA